MFGELRSHFDGGSTGAAGGLTGAPGSYSKAYLQGAGTQRLASPNQAAPGNGQQQGLAAQALAMIDGLPSLSAPPPSGGSSATPHSTAALRVPVRPGLRDDGRCALAGAYMTYPSGPDSQTEPRQAAARPRSAQSRTGGSSNPCTQSRPGTRPRPRSATSSASAAAFSGPRCAYSAEAPLLPYSAKPLPGAWADSAPVSIAGHTAPGGSMRPSRSVATFSQSRVGSGYNAACSRPGSAPGRPGSAPGRPAAANGNSAPRAATE